ncbi:MAG TPA: HAD family phosphatase [Limnochordia bacterium]|nr:HAD family phosphatase [Limnochordia bacterium]
MSLQAVVFDVGGVLLALGEAAYRRELFAQLGFADVPAGYEAFVPALQRGEADEVAVWRQLSGREVAADAFDGIWLRHFPEDAAMLQLAADLRAAGLRTGVFSNTQASHARCMRQMGFLTPFHPVWLSCEVGVSKPDTAAYRLMVEQLGCEPPEIAFVDDRADNVAAAAACGLHGVRHTGDVQATRTRLFALAGGPPQGRKI